MLFAVTLHCRYAQGAEVSTVAIAICCVFVPTLR